MWNYEKRLQYPVNIKTPNPKIAQIIMSQYGGPDGEIGASMRYLSQRFAMTSRIAMGTLTDIGIEAPEMFPFLTPPPLRALRTAQTQSRRKPGNLSCGGSIQFTPYFCLLGR